MAIQLSITLRYLFNILSVNNEKKLISLHTQNLLYISS